MLVLARKLNQSIIIGDDIRIKVVEVSKDQVKLGIDAPRCVSVHREEIYLEIQKENIAAQKVSQKEVEKLQSIWQQEEKG